MLEMLIIEAASWVIATGIVAFFVKLAIYATLVFAIIGFVTTIRFFVSRKKKTSSGEEWLKTGRMK